MTQDKNRTGLIIGILILIIIVLSIFLLYSFVIKPRINGYLVNAQYDGYAYAISQIGQQVVTCQPVPLIFGNQTINIVAVDCLSQECLQQCLQQPQQ